MTTGSYGGKVKNASITTYNRVTTRYRGRVPNSSSVGNTRTMTYTSMTNHKCITINDRTIVNLGFITYPGFLM